MIEIPSYIEAVEMVSKHPKNYKQTSLKIEKGYILHTFDYMPGSDKKKIKGKGLEMRGLSFLENPKKNTIKRYLSLRKFYNLNEIEETLIEKLKNNKISNITLKKDGSLISFLNIDNKAIAKTRNGMKSISAQLANEIVKNKQINDSIIRMINKGYYPFFEITGINNIIVIFYPETELTLLQIRNEEGNYLNRKEIKKLCKEVGFPTEYIVKEEEKNSLEYFHQVSKTLTDIEGWVVMFDSQNMVKIKTKWYLEEKIKLYNDKFKWKDLLISIINEDLNEDELIKLPTYKRNFINSMKIKISYKFENFYNEIISDFTKMKKNCYLNNQNNKALKLTMKLLGTNKIILREYIKKEFLSKYKKESDCRKLFMKTKD